MVFSLKPSTAWAFAIPLRVLSKKNKIWQENFGSHLLQVEGIRSNVLYRHYKLGKRQLKCYFRVGLLEVKKYSIQAHKLGSCYLLESPQSEWVYYKLHEVSLRVNIVGFQGPSERASKILQVPLLSVFIQEGTDFDRESMEIITPEPQLHRVVWNSL